MDTLSDLTGALRTLSSVALEVSRLLDAVASSSDETTASRDMEHAASVAMPVDVPVTETRPALPQQDYVLLYSVLAQSADRYAATLEDAGPLAVYDTWQHDPSFRAMPSAARQTLVAAIGKTDGNEKACEVSRDLLRR